VFRFTATANAELAVPSMAPQLVETVIEALAVATHISDHYLGKGGELSSSGHAIHPGETAMRKAPLALFEGRDASTTIRPSTP
jgi:hypothetical protein